MATSVIPSSPNLWPRQNWSALYIVLKPDMLQKSTRRNFQQRQMQKCPTVTSLMRDITAHLCVYMVNSFKSYSACLFADHSPMWIRKNNKGCMIVMLQKNEYRQLRFNTMYPSIYAYWSYWQRSSCTQSLLRSDSRYNELSRTCGRN